MRILGEQKDEEADQGQQDLRAEVEDGQDDVDPRRFLDAHDVDRDEEGDGEDAAERVVRPGLQHRPEGGQIVGHEEGGDGDGDDVVEHERPAGAEAHELVERVAREARGAARLGKHRRRLGVRERGGDEQEPGEHEHDRRKAHRRRRDHAQGVVDRRADVAVGGAEQRRHAEHLVQALSFSLLASCHRSLALGQVM